MRQPRDSTNSEPAVKVLRLDPAHAPSTPHPSQPVLSSRRVRQVLAGAPDLYSQRQLGTEASAGTALRVCPATESPDPKAAVTGRRVIQRFRQNFHTLSHIARDPLVWAAEDEAILAELRETLSLTELALGQFETIAPLSQPVAATESILAIAETVEQRVDQLFDRMERFTGLRHCAYRLSAILESVTANVAPRMREVKMLARDVLDLSLGDSTLTLLHAESTNQSLQVATHGVNVAQVVARLAWSESMWRDDCGWAVAGALLEDCGMMEVRSEVFHSTEPLTSHEWILVHQHPAASRSILKQMRDCDDRLATGVYQHHERLDGSGYPDRARGSEITPLGRLLAVADAYVGMQSPRAYRPALGAEQTLGEIGRAAAAGKLDWVWTERLPTQPPRWLKISAYPVPPTGAPAISALAA